MALHVPSDAPVAATPLALNLELSHGRHGATARVEWHRRGGEQVAVVRLSGWIDRVAAQRLTRVLDDVAERGARQLIVDCAALRHVDYRLVPALVDALSRFESHAGGFVVCGLSRYLRDVFRLAGCEPRLRCWPSAADLLAGDVEPVRERAS